MPKELNSVQEALDYLTDQLVEVKAESLANRAAAGIALGIMLQNSADKGAAMKALRSHLSHALAGVKVTGGDPESDKNLVGHAQRRLVEMADELEQGLKS
jgi:hypothetical protein